MPGQASIGGSSTSSSTTHLEVMGHQTHTSGDDGNTGEEQKDDDGEHDDEEFEDGMDRLLHCSGLDGWETDLDEDAEMEEKEEKEPPNAVETVHPDNMETLEFDTESMDHTMAIESQWRLCGDQGGEDKESDHEDEKKPEELEDSKDLLTTHKICIIHYTVHLK